METRNQRLIRQILNEEVALTDTSLRAQAMRRARKDDVPRTMTPFEWEQWQAENGVPETLRRPRGGDDNDKSWLARLFRR